MGRAVEGFCPDHRDLIKNFKTVSRKHCIIQRKDYKTLVLKNCNPDNLTWIHIIKGINEPIYNLDYFSDFQKHYFKLKFQKPIAMQMAKFYPIYEANN